MGAEQDAHLPVARAPWEVYDTMRPLVRLRCLVAGAWRTMQLSRQPKLPPPAMGAILVATWVEALQLGPA